jgi:thioredoxin-like negative regulator of GroEL
MEETSWKDREVKEQVKKYGKQRIFKVDADKWPDWIKRFKITGLPTVMIVSAKNYDIIARHEGYMNDNELEGFLKQSGNMGLKSGPASKIKNPK